MSDSAIDSTSIAPTQDTNHVRQNSLEKHLQHRPDPQELKDRHILLDTNAAPSLQAKALELERQLATDNLKKSLSNRSDRSELIERNILRSSTAAPSIVAQQRELEKQMRADSLNNKLSARPQKEELVKGGILSEDEADRLYEENIEDEYAKREGGA